MAYYGYYKFAGTEIINVARLRAYQQNLNLHWLKVGYEDSEFMPALLGETYRTPVLDPAPWVDPDNPDSVDFYGVYPIKITGIEDSTRDAQVSESILDGGVVGRVRLATRTAVFEVALMAGSESAAVYGFNWLKKALLGRGCSTTATCAGEIMEYLSAAPFYDPIGPTPDENNPNLVYARLDGGFWIGDVDYSVDVPLIDGGTPSSVYSENFDGGTPSVTGGLLTEPYPFPFGPEPVPPFDPTDCLFEFKRHLRNVTITQGPSVTRRKELTTGDQVWIAQFTMVAGTPWEFGETKDILTNWLSGSTSWGKNVTGGTLSIDDEEIIDDVCPTTVWTPLVDPLCPALVAPPTVPAVDLGCFDPPSTWRRRQFTIPADQIPLWDDVVPVITVNANFDTLRNLRLRFWPDDGTHVVDDPCIIVADLLFSYVPESYTIVFDGAARQIYSVDGVGNTRRADSLVFGSDGSPFDWPVFSCGEGLIVTADLPYAQSEPIIDVSLVSRSA